MPGMAAPDLTGPTPTADALATYRAVHRRSLTDREGFWLEAAEAVDWTRRPTRALDDSRPPFYRWFPDGELNTCVNALDRHVAAGRGDQAALLHDSPVTGTTARLSYADLLDQVSRFAGVLRGLGVSRGDRVVLYMPMVPEAVVAMLACARLGAVQNPLIPLLRDFDPRIAAAAASNETSASRTRKYGRVMRPPWCAEA